MRGRWFNSRAPDFGGKTYAVNVNCLDDAELAALAVRYVDGRNDNWETPGSVMCRWPTTYC